MAITNAQQYQQLVNKPANGKRPGYRGPGGYQGSSGSSSSSSSSSSGSNQGPAGGASAGGNYGGNVNAQQKYAGRTYANQNYATQASVNAANQRAAQRAIAAKANAREKARLATIAEQKKLADIKAKAIADKKAKDLSNVGKSKTTKFGTVAKNIFDKTLLGRGLNKFKKFSSNLQKQNYMQKMKEDDPLGYAEMVENLRGLGEDNEPNLGDTDTFNVETGLENNSGGLGMREDLVFGPEGDADLEFGDLSRVKSLGGKFGFGEGYDDYLDRFNTTDGRGDNDGSNRLPPIISQQPITPVTPLPVVGSTTSSDPFSLAPRFMGSIFDFSGGRTLAADGGMMMKKEYRDLLEEDEMEDPTGGIMDLETGRQQYFLGKLVKKATRAVKKVAKSPIGKAALLYGLGSLGAGALGKYNAGTGTGFFSGLKGKLFGQAALGAKKVPGMGPLFKPATEGLLGKLGITKGAGSFMPTLKGGIGLGLGIPFALDALGVGKEEEDDNSAYEQYMKDMRLDIPALRARRNLAPAFDGSTYNYEAYADGGRTGYAEGSDEPVAKKTMPLLDMDGQEMDLREEGGFVPLGRMERADDVPARLSKNEFVFTADAVRNAGEGDIDKGAEVMYNMMKNLESGGEVSEESQGLEGAREMFQTSQRLEEVL